MKTRSLPSRTTTISAFPAKSPAWTGVFLVSLGCIFGISIILALLTYSPGKTLGTEAILAAALAGAAMGTVFLFLLRSGVRALALRLPLSPEAMAAYFRFDVLAYSPFALALLLGAGVRISVPTVYLLALLFALAQSTCLLSAIWRNRGGKDFFASPGWVGLLFLVSGMAALIYEIVWQRMLFAAYGINIESITIIVSLFMFGLGTGSLAGGLLSRSAPRSLPYLFVLCELAIGGFGIISLPLMRAVADRTSDLSLAGVTLSAYALLSLPTFFMGATLPILVAFLHGRSRDIGKTVGLLYFFNTIGSALACFLTVDVLFVFLGRQATVLVAAGLNLCVALAVLAYAAGARRGDWEPGEAPRSGPGLSGHGFPRLSFPLVLALACAAGFLSLSQEMLWVRAIAYNAQGAPQVFGHILGFFLVGIALGSWQGKRFCEAPRAAPLAYMAGLLLLGSLAFYCALPLLAQASLLGKGVGLAMSFLAVGGVAFLFGQILPILCHFGIRSGSPVGVRLSWIYMANIIGSTGGPLLTGFVLMDRFSLETNIRTIALLGLAISIGMVCASPLPRARKAILVLGAAGAASLAVWFHGGFYARMLEKLHFGSKYSSARDYKHLVQNRSGILAVKPDARGDVIYGGGGYDGRFNTDPVGNSNGIRRVFMLAALHPRPAEILQVGLSSGSWAQVAASHAEVRKLEVVEINPGYPELIRRYPEHRGILSDPKIAYHFDDGRRWLRRHPGARFDVILMNTTFHWRSNSTNLLSREFLELAKAHLRPGGIVYYNTTGSPDVIRTAAAVFRHVAVYSTFVAAGDSPFALDREQRAANLLKFVHPGGAPLLDTLDPAGRKAWREMAEADLPELSGAYKARTDLEVITDDNMLTEFKKITDTDAIGYLYRVFDADRSWGRLWRTSPDPDLRRD